MKKQLEKITNLTLNELLNNKIILPSLYFEKFDYYAKDIEIDLDDENFKNEIENIIVDDFKTIEKYMNSIMSNVSELKEETNNAKNAIINKDINSLNDIYKNMIKLEKEVKRLNNELFIDEETKIFNRKWIYTKFLDEEYLFRNNGVLLLIDVVDYFYVQKEYGELLAKNLIVFIINFINEKFKDEKYNIQIARYFDDKIFVFILEEDFKEINNFIINIEKMLSIITLKSNSGLLIKANYKFHYDFFKSADESKKLFEKLLDLSKVSS